MFHPGSITKIQLSNFLTYDECTISPGPSMNMIIGPNGSGKSTIVCAIAIGLGTSTSVLGRMKDLNSFIKHGKDRASITITLAPRNPNEQPIIISRTWKKTSSTSSDWTLNGKKSSAKEIENLTTDLGIQVDNLCQFLAQERVVEFAKMDGIKLFEETLRAAAPEGTLEQLLELRSMHSEIKKMTSDKSHLLQELESLKSQNERIKNQVERIQERESNESKISLLKIKRKWLEYDAARDHFMEIKSDKEKLKEILAKTTALLQPFEAKLDRYKSLKIKSTPEAQGDCLVANPKSIDQIERNFAQLLAIHNDRQVRALELQSWKTELRQIEASLALGPQALEAQEQESACLLTQINKLNQNLEQFQQAHFSNERLKRSIEGESEGLQREIESINQKISQMDNVLNQRLEKLRKEAPDSYTASIWIQKNISNFQGQVFLPACVEVMLKRGDWAGEMEELLSQNVLTLIVCDNSKDFEVLQTELLDRQKLKVNLHLQQEPLSNYATKISLAKIKSLGFQGFLADFIDAPEPVKAALCQTGQIHWLPLAKGPIKEAELDREIVRFCADGLVWGIYGGEEAKDRIVRTKRISPPRVLGIGSDMQKREELQSRLVEIREYREANRAKINQILEQETISKRKEESLLAEKNELVAQRRNLIAQITEFTSLKEKKRILNQRIIASSKKRDLKEIRAISQSLKPQISSIVDFSSLSLSFPLEKPLEICQKALSTKHTAIIEAEMKDLRAKINQLQSQLQNLAVVLSEAKSRAKELLEEAQSQPLSVEEKRELESAPATIQELDSQIHRLQALLSLNSDLDERIIGEYHERCDQIAKNTKLLDDISTSMQQKTTQASEIGLQFYNITSALIDLINVRYGAYFSRLSCVGQVRMAEGWPSQTASLSSFDNLDSDKWSLEILVKFRESAELASLSPYRQSGGERSVSTFLYLLSLQGISRAPFRVVDEINQGMDAQNEARMHAFMVEATENSANSESSQCFVVTPKLLSNLSYGPNVTILCIFNGFIEL